MSYIHDWLSEWLRPRYKQYLYEDEAGRLWRINPNNDTRVEIKPLEDKDA